jgi:hypothetical protein
VESDETFTLALERAVNARFGVAQVVQSATATIRDHQVIGRFSVADQTFSEAAGVVNVVIALTAPATADVTVQVETSDLTASAGSDYAGISSGTLTFAPGEVTALLPLTLLDDKLIEGPETLRLTLSNPVGAPLGRSEATLTIEDDDRRSPVPEPRNGGGGGTAAWLNMLLVLALVVRSRKWRLTVANAF